MKKTTIKLANISKEYILHHQKPTLAENLFKFYQKKEKIWALKNINLNIKQGEKIGIIGNNGSGKTTLLKIISGITAPTTGKVNINGKIASLIDLKAGFHPELTGLENIFLNGLLLGMGKKEIKNKLNKIIKFSELKKFIDVPLNTYSKGMIFRLGFSIAIHSNPDILLIDEILAVGDQAFQKKCFQAIEKMFSKHITVIYVAHNQEFLRNLCQKCIWLEKNRIKKVGKIKNILSEYNKTIN